MQYGYKNKKCGLLGEHLSHSFSPVIHNMIADYSYKIFEVAPDNLESFVLNNELDALNVTIPYKKSVIPYLDEISSEASSIGAVNLIVKKNGKLCGHNTDYFGFEYMVNASKVALKGKKAIVLGKGGAAVTICTVLRDKGIGEIISVDKEDNTKEFLSRHADANVVINATPVGMYPRNGASPVDLDLFPACEAVLDIVYNPMRTALMLQAERKGITAVGGLSMLVAQAVRGFEIFTQSRSEDGIIENIIAKIAKDTQNIILIGMPSCGKSTIGKLVANALGREFFDADTEFERMHSITPESAINELGEDAFRKKEIETLASLGKMSGAVIATGGGTVTREENYPSLHQNGIIVYIKRDLSLLSTDGRPLSKAGKLEELFQKRKALYEAFADVTVENSGTPDDAATVIQKEIETMKVSCLIEGEKKI